MERETLDGYVVGTAQIPDAPALDLAALTPEAAEAIAVLVVALVQPLYTSAEAQVAATLLLVAQARRIADAVELYAPVPGELLEAPADDTSAAGCPHPEDQRVSFASSGNDDFFCKACETHIPQPHAGKERT